MRQYLPTTLALPVSPFLAKLFSSTPKNFFFEIEIDDAALVGGATLTEADVIDIRVGDQYQLINDTTYLNFTPLDTFTGQLGAAGDTIISFTWEANGRPYALFTYDASAGDFIDGNVNANLSTPLIINFNNLSTVPIPAASWLFGSAILGLIGIRRSKSN